MASERKAYVVRKCVINNANSAGRKKPVGQVLTEMGDRLAEWCALPRIQVFVREKPICRYNMDAIMLFRVCGMADHLLWQIREMSWQEYPVTTIRKWVTGNGHSSKETTAQHLVHYVGEVGYRTDDESDAVAVGLTWL